MRFIQSKLISPIQATFVPGCWIVDNSLPAQEIIHAFSKRRGYGGLMDVKLDIQKAYDQVKWGFILPMLETFGFCPILFNGLLSVFLLFLFKC